MASIRYSPYGTNVIKMRHIDLQYIRRKVQEKIEYIALHYVKELVFITVMYNNKIESVYRLVVSLWYKTYE